MIYHIRERGVPLHACEWYMDVLVVAAEKATSLGEFMEHLLDSRISVEHDTKKSAKEAIKNLRTLYSKGKFTVVDGPCPYIEHKLREGAEIETMMDVGKEYTPTMH
jgi:hypothetical protein